MGIHGKNSNLYFGPGQRNFRKLARQKRREKTKNLGLPKKEGDVNPLDFGLLTKKAIHKKRKTNPFAPVNLSGKKRHKILKTLKRIEKSRNTMEVCRLDCPTPSTSKTYQDDLKMELAQEDKSKKSTDTNKMEIS